MDLLITIAVIAALILALLYFTGRMKYRSMAPLQRPAGMWRPVPTPDCLYPTPTGLCKQPYHLEL
jgi:hypothetical protein